MSSTACALAPEYPDGLDEARSICPLLEIEKPTCNCSNFPLTVKVIVDPTDFFVPETQLPNANSDDELLNEVDEVLNINVSETEEHINEPQTEPDDEEQFSEVMVLKGSSFHKHFQEALHSCKQLLLNGTAPQLCMSQEPMNKQDENAIVVKALLGLWTPIGYIPAIKLPKVTDAINKSEITVVVLDNVIYRYVYAIKHHIYFAKVLLTKKNTWLPNSKTYDYNDKI